MSKQKIAEYHFHTKTNDESLVEFFYDGNYITYKFTGTVVSHHKEWMSRVAMRGNKLLRDGVDISRLSLISPSGDEGNSLKWEVSKEQVEKHEFAFFVTENLELVSDEQFVHQNEEVKEAIELIANFLEKRKKKLKNRVDISKRN
jgi:hypothetical protein